jgi:hypothetical protein
MKTETIILSAAGLVGAYFIYQSFQSPQSSQATASVPTAGGGNDSDIPTASTNSTATDADSVTLPDTTVSSPSAPLTTVSTASVPLTTTDGDELDSLASTAGQSTSTTSTQLTASNTAVVPTQTIVTGEPTPVISQTLTNVNTVPVAGGSRASKPANTLTQSIGKAPKPVKPVKAKPIKPHSVAVAGSTVKVKG